LPRWVIFSIPAVQNMDPARFGLQSKIVLITATAVILVAGVSTLTALWLTGGPVEEEVYRRALVLGRLTTPQLISRDGLQNPESLVKILTRLEHDQPGLVQCDVYTHEPQPHLLVSTNPKGDHTELDNLPDVENYNGFFRPGKDQMSIETPDGDFWIISTTIRIQGQPVGCLNLKVSKSHLNAVTWDLVLRNLVLIVGSLAVVALVIHFFFLRSVRRPVKEMIRVMESAEQGQLDTRAKLLSRDETGQLAEHLNRMLDRLRNFNDELAGKVEEATHEAAERNVELKRINEELFETQKKLARSERLAVAGQLAASLAHEIGTPLNSISGHVQLLARQKNADEVTVRRLQTIDAQIENIVRTVKQLLSWTHRLDLQVGPVDLRHLLEESVLLSSPGFHSRKIKVRATWPQENIRVFADAGYLQQVFINLINNSMDAMLRGGELHIRLSRTRDTASANRAQGGIPGGPPEVLIEFEDTGEGIAPETLGHIFEPMFTTKRMGAGTGLGLAVCDQIIREHGGTIHVWSEMGRGTRFTILLPVDCREKIATLAGATGGSGASRS
jgi:two-component system, NtrC family, sensor kinase